MRKHAVARSLGLGAAIFTAAGIVPSHGIEQRNEVSYLRGPYNIAFFKRHKEAFRVGAALHFSHGKQHDVLLLTPKAVLGYSRRVGPDALLAADLVREDEREEDKAANPRGARLPPAGDTPYRLSSRGGSGTRRRFPGSAGEPGVSAVVLTTAPG